MPIAAAKNIDLVASLSAKLSATCPESKTAGSKLNPNRLDSTGSTSDTSQPVTAEQFGQTLLSAMEEMQTAEPGADSQSNSNTSQPATSPALLSTDISNLQFGSIRAVVDKVLTGKLAVSAPIDGKGVVLHQAADEILQALRQKHQEPPQADALTVTQSPPSCYVSALPATVLDTQNQEFTNSCRPAVGQLTGSSSNIRSIVETPSVDAVASTADMPQSFPDGNILILEGQIRPIQADGDLPAVITRSGIDTQKITSGTPPANPMRLSEEPGQSTKTVDPPSLLQAASNADGIRNSKGSQFSFSQGSKDREQGGQAAAKANPLDMQVVTSTSAAPSEMDLQQIRSVRPNISSSKTDTLPMDQQVPTSQTSSKTDLTVRLQGQSGENINVRVSERGGEIQLSIRSTDQATASALRHELPGLQAGLERSGWQLDAGQARRDSSDDFQGQQQNKDARSQDPDWKDRRQQQRNSSTGQWFDLNE